MKNLIVFNLKRRFMNKTFLVMNLIVFLLITVIVNVDLIIEVINPNFDDKLEISISELDINLKQYLLQIDDKYVHFNEEEQEVKMTFDNEFIINSEYAIDPLALTMINEYVNLYYNHSNKIMITNKVEVESKDNVFIFFIITGIYFIVLTTATSTSSEIVHDKMSKSLEQILICIDEKVYFISKVLTTWLTLILTMITYLVSFIFIVIIRNLYDQCFGIIRFIENLNILQFENDTLFGVLGSISITLEQVIVLIVSLLFLILGIITVQIIMIFVSSNITSVEESANIQSFFYMILMVIYYLSLSLNNQESLSTGLGYILSFIPVLSLLFMPSRLAMFSVSNLQIIFSLGIAITTIYLIYNYGIKGYKKNLINFDKKKERKLFLSK